MDDIGFKDAQDAAEVIKEFNKMRYDDSKQDIKLVADLRKTDLTDIQIAKVLTIYDDICRHCYDADSYCQCWNDE